jgi:hypothetical protein
VKRLTLIVALVTSRGWEGPPQKPSQPLGDQALTLADAFKRIGHARDRDVEVQVAAIAFVAAGAPVLRHSHSGRHIGRDPTTRW